MIKKVKLVAKLGVMFSGRKKIVLLDSILLLGTMVTSIRIFRRKFAIYSPNVIVSSRISAVLFQ
jgi:hypothetical protein